MKAFIVFSSIIALACLTLGAFLHYARTVLSAEFWLWAAISALLVLMIAAFTVLFIVESDL